MGSSWGLALLSVLALMAGVAGDAYAGEMDSRKDILAAKSSPEYRGGIVYKTYCVLCHGHRGDGMGRATKLYGQGNLVVSMTDHDDGYYEKMVRQGGPAVGRSRFMPAWEDELSEEQLNDVMTYLKVVRDPVQRGKVVFMINCILCHGVKANGKGRASVLYDPPPADLTRSDKNDQYKRMIITMGGAAMGRSAVMPQWGLQLSDDEIEDVVAYLRTVLVGVEQ